MALKAASINHRELFIAHGQYPGMALPAICMLIVIFVFAAGGYIASR